MTNGGWTKYAGNPVLGGKLGTCFDVCVLWDAVAANDQARWRMWFSWRDRDSLALTESDDGVHWSDPTIVLGPRPETGWEDVLNRPVVARRDGVYHLWYTGQAHGNSAIGYAVSDDGRRWVRCSDEPVLTAHDAWEKGAVMCPWTLWDAKKGCWRLWYSAGDQYEPDALGYAESLDGKSWTRDPGNPVLRPDKTKTWESDKVTAAQIFPYHGGFAAFYIGFRDQDHATIGAAWSPDGVHNWRRHPDNPLITPDDGAWDHDACYKPAVCFRDGGWWLWYNGRHGDVEQIGLATHLGEDLGLG